MQNHAEIYPFLTYTGHLRACYTKYTVCVHLHDQFMKTKNFVIIIYIDIIKAGKQLLQKFYKQRKISHCQVPIPKQTNDEGNELTEEHVGW